MNRRALISLALAAVLIATLAWAVGEERPTGCDHLLKTQADAMEPRSVDADEAVIRCFKKEALK